MGVLEFFKSKFTRKAFRRAAKFSVHISKLKVKNKKEWFQPEFMGQGTKISEKGAQVDTQAPLVVGDQVELKFALREGAKMVEVVGIVRNIQVSLGNKITVGFEFYKPSTEVSKYLSTILQIYRT